VRASGARIVAALWLCQMNSESSQRMVCGFYFFIEDHGERGATPIIGKLEGASFGRISVWWF